MTESLPKNGKCHRCDAELPGGKGSEHLIRRGDQEVIAELCPACSGPQYICPKCQTVILMSESVTILSAVDYHLHTLCPKCAEAEPQHGPGIVQTDASET